MLTPEQMDVITKSTLEAKQATRAITLLENLLKTESFSEMSAKFAARCQFKLATGMPEFMRDTLAASAALITVGYEMGLADREPVATSPDLKEAA